MVVIPSGTYKFKNDAMPTEGQQIMLPIVATVVPFELNSTSYNGIVTTDVFDGIIGINVKYSDTVRYVLLGYAKQDETLVNVYINDEPVLKVDALLPIYIESETDVPWDTGYISDEDFVRFSSVIGGSVEGFGQTIRVLEDAEIEDDASGNWFLNSTIRVSDVVYPNADTVVAKLQRIINDTNAVTNKNDTTIVDAVTSLMEKYGKAQEWDPTAPNSVIIKGNPVENKKPLAYHLTSVDELPVDAVDGSLAVVTENSVVTAWVFNDELPNLGESYSAWADNDYRSPFVINYDSDNTECTFFSLGTEGSDSWGIYSLYLGERGKRYTHNPSGSYGITHGWVFEDDKTITVTYADDEALAWLKKHASERTTTITTTTLYSRENGEWVNKGEI